MFLHHGEVRRHDFLDGQLLQLPHIRLLDSELGEKQLRISDRDVAIDDFDGRAAFDDRAVKSPLAEGMASSVSTLRPAARLAEYHHRVWIATEFGNVGMHPFERFERLNDVQHAGVAGGREIRLNSLKFAKPRTLRR